MPKIGDLYILHLEIPDWYYQDILKQHLYHVTSIENDMCYLKRSYPKSHLKLPEQEIIGLEEFDRPNSFNEACLTKDGRIRSVYFDPDSI